MKTVWDSSAITPLVWRENSTSILEGIAQQSDDLNTSIVSWVEVCSAIARKIREGVVAPSEVLIVRGTIEDVMSAFTHKPVDTGVVSCADSILFSHALRAYDAIQLATWMHIAETSEASPAFVTLDQRLRTVATHVGATVLP